MMTILVTGFEPFRGEALNPSWEAVRRLGGDTGDARIERLLVPTTYAESIGTVTEAIDRLRPAAVVMVGQAGGRAELSIERVAVNCDDAQTPDNAGVLHEDAPIVSQGPTAYLATLPIKQIVARLRSAGFPAAVSNTAGLFVCNHLFYGVLNHIVIHNLETQAGFIHMPFLPEQVVGKPGTPSMSLETMVAGLDCMVAVLTSNAQP
ncbi:pyroglutamyl-peptidase I [Candidatus Cryosericum septentrionale]|jgi:pyroglutamyl-peptidase|uniref:Pyrrolidone-carboxylate peptidase n=1 Tax=Candidatus Cryosericum septentrionale TaxID=2290913 RepID=A0A398DRM4_9BACT|nr:pyroglutamyl-peptidase I [Candidatus Cryosericum septentrionale]RIE17570.1 pyroglutamyl-peptidase I [Candidatus Cryosericum septentrionale]